MDLLDEYAKLCEIGEKKKINHKNYALRNVKIILGLQSTARKTRIFALDMLIDSLSSPVNAVHDNTGSNGKMAAVDFITKCPPKSDLKPFWICID